MSSGRNTHWCHRCQRAVQLHGREPVCSYCGGGFVEELDMAQASPFDMLRSHRDVVEHDPTFDLMDALCAFMRNRLTERSHDREIRGRAISSAPLLIFGGQVPYRLSGDNAVEALFNGGSPGISITRETTEVVTVVRAAMKEEILSLPCGHFVHPVQAQTPLKGAQETRTQLMRHITTITSNSKSHIWITVGGLLITKDNLKMAGHECGSRVFDLATFLLSVPASAAGEDSNKEMEHQSQTHET